jgi:hypothetical protein
MEAQTCGTINVKASFILQSQTKTSTYLLGIYFKEDPSSKDVQITADMALYMWLV